MQLTTTKCSGSAGPLESGLGGLNKGKTKRQMENKRTANSKKERNEKRKERERRE
jgi:hypothetical protein